MSKQKRQELFEIYSDLVPAFVWCNKRSENVSLPTLPLKVSKDIPLSTSNGHDVLNTKFMVYSGLNPI